MQHMVSDKQHSLLTVRQTAAELGLHPISVYRMIREGRLPALQLGGRGAPLRVDRAELDAWLYREQGQA
jgi:excisionase family DNA binding protein